MFSKTCFVVTLLSIFLLSYRVQCQDTKEKSFSTSIAGMEQLIDMERILIESVEQYTLELQAKIIKLKNLVTQLKQESDKALIDPEKYLFNPLNGYSLIRRMHHDWPHIELYMTASIGTAYIDVIKQLRPQMPTLTDVKEASEAIYRLQITYGLEPIDMAEGLLNGKQYDVSLTSIDRYSMAHHLYVQGEHYYAAFWSYSAIMSYDNTEYNEIVEFTEDQVYLLYAETLMKQNRPKDALIPIQHALDIKPDDASLMKRRNSIHHLSNITESEAVAYSIPEANPYELACQGNFSNIPSRFHCVYNTTTSPFLRLAPLKMEILQLEPYLVKYHDIITDREIEELRTMARPILKRATVYSEDSERAQVVNTRTAQSSGFFNWSSSTVHRMNQLIEDMTGFDDSKSEVLQVMNYGLGGHYDTHYDFFNVSETNEVVREEGDRIATVLIYLTDVEQGGATVFPNVKTAVFPRKGSAIMWYNLKNDLEGDSLTLHAACPVLVGSKWVSNKWIRSKDQMFRRPCYK